MTYDEILEEFDKLHELHRSLMSGLNDILENERMSKDLREKLAKLYITTKHGDLMK